MKKIGVFNAFLIVLASLPWISYLILWIFNYNLGEVLFWFLWTFTMVNILLIYWLYIIAAVIYNLKRCFAKKELAITILSAVICLLIVLSYVLLYRYGSLLLDKLMPD
jgi:hypothetical protein